MASPQPHSRPPKEIRQFVGHRAHITCLAVSPDGSALLTGASDGTVRLWDVATGEQTRRLRPSKWMLFCGAAAAAFSSDGSTMLTAEKLGPIRIWSRESGQQIMQLRRPSYGSLFWWMFTWSHAALSPDGRHIVAGWPDSTVRVYEASDGKEISKVVTSGDGVTAVAVSPDGAQFATASRGGAVQLWSMPGGEVVRCVQPTLNQRFLAARCLAYSPRGMTLAAGFTYGFAVLWDVMNGSELDRFGENHGVDVHSAVFSPDGERLVTTGGDCAALIWEIRTRRLVQSLDCRRGRWVTSDRTPVAFSPDGRFLFGGCCDKRVRMWELPD